MDLFHYVENELHCEGLPLSSLAKQFGTPLFVYSESTLRRHCQEFIRAFAGYDFLPCYAVKANSNLSLMRAIFSEGFGADIVSQGELERALKCGLNPQKIVYSGVGKRESEIERAIDVGILSFNAESPAECRVINSVAKRRNKVAPVSLRINPNIEVKTHPHITTGLYNNKFGMDETAARTLACELKDLNHVRLIGLDCHIGSQILELEPFGAAARRMLGLIRELKSQGHPIEHLDLGGGFGIRYREGETPPDLKDYAQTLLKELKDSGLKLILEPGRVLVGNAGVLLTSVILTKETPTTRFVVVDAAMNDLIRPSLYEAYHQIDSVKLDPGNHATAEYNVVGPVCETGDFLGLNRKLTPPTPGSLLCVRSAGAYGMAMSSNYNTRPRACEVLVNVNAVKEIRRRETVESLWAAEEVTH